MLTVDDCTGEILCRHNHHCEKNLRVNNEIEELQDMVAAKNFQEATECGAAMESILEVVFKKNKISMNPLEQGDCAHLQGFIGDFFGTREIWAFKLHKVSSKADEVDRVFEVSALYSSVYSQ
ncbi:CST complex subunit STN1 [Frankliniella fusca]|uniref:CST complex subunit STN1 n=1 Tax=Frankliniella fusca TaxID=407009 RepID=A0AAE1HU62_9NEOP|nr:CST complex subunit STN1 [Frankliniella fusca]